MGRVSKNARAPKLIGHAAGAGSSSFDDHRSGEQARRGRIEAERTMLGDDAVTFWQHYATVWPRRVAKTGFGW